MDNETNHVDLSPVMSAARIPALQRMEDIRHEGTNRSSRNLGAEFNPYETR